MTLDELARKIVANKKEFGITNIPDAHRAIHAVMGGLKQCLIECETFKYHGFGEFVLQKKGRREIHNVLVRGDMIIPESLAVKFKPHRSFKLKLNANAREKGLIE